MERSDWKILLVDDDEDDYVLVRKMLSATRHRKVCLQWASSFQAGQKALEQETYDAVLVDYDIGVQSGVQIIREAVARNYNAPILLLTGRGSYDIDVDAMEAGASDYLSKGDMTAAFLERAIRYAIERKKNDLLQRANEAALRESVQRIEALNAINTRIIQVPQSDETLKCVLELANTAMCSDAVHISIREDGIWSVPFSYNLDHPLIERTFTDEDSTLSLRVLRTGETLIFDRNTFFDENQTAIVEKLGSKNALLLPIYADGKVIGVLGFDWINNEWTATPESIDFAQKLAASLSLAISSRRLFDGMQVEIEERKHAEEELRISEAHYQESERRFRQTFENAAVGIAHVGLDGRFLRVNKSLCEITGYSSIELLQKTFQEITHPEDLEEDLRMSERLKAGEIESYTIEKRYLRKDGSTIWANLTGSVQYDSAGGIECFIAVVNDISLQKIAEQTLRESEQYVRNIIDTLFIYVGVLTVDGVLIEANKAPLQAAGISREDVYGLPFEDTYWWNYSPAVKQRLREAVKQAANGVSSRFDIEVQVAGGRLLPVDFMIAPMRGENGEILYLIPSAVDISARKQAEQSLRLSEERLRVALSSVPIYVYNMDKDLRYTWVHNLLPGTDQEDVNGKTDAEIFPPEISQEIMAAKREVIESGRAMPSEMRIPWGGEMKYFMVSNSPIFNADGEVVGLVGSAYDVTEQRMVETQKIEYTTQMEVQRRLSEYREKERQGIAREIHDGPIQTLVSTMFGIQAAISIVQDQTALAELEQVRDGMKNAVRELRETINELRPPLLIRFGLSRAIRVHAEDFRANQPGTTLHLDLQNDENLLPEEVCLALYRIYQEGLNNVMRHANATEMWVRLLRRENDLVLEIEDNGKGFSGSGNLAQLMQEGHFGLAGMRERAEGIGGRFEVASTPNQGTRIRVTVNL